MTITDLVAPEAIVPALKVSSKKQALQELSARASALTAQNERVIFELFPLQQHLENRPLVLTGERSRTRGKILQRLLLAADLQRRHDRLGCDEISDRHRDVPGIGLFELAGLFKFFVAAVFERLDADRPAKGGGP